MKKLFYNGNILTLDPDNSIAAAILVENGRILEVLDHSDLARTINNDSIHRIDLKGKTVMPGFNDNHVHLNFYGDYLNAPNFKNLNETQIISLLKAKYPDPEKNRIIYGYEWDHPACKNPTKEILDAVFPKNPVILSQYGGHSYWVNSVTLRKMGVWETSDDAVDGIVRRDSKGEPVGIVNGIKNNAFMIQWFLKRLLSFKGNLKNMSKALEECSRYGITSVQDNTWSFNSVRVLRRLY